MQKLVTYGMDRYIHLTVPGIVAYTMASLKNLYCTEVHGAKKDQIDADTEVAPRKVYCIENVSDLVYSIHLQGIKENLFIIHQ